MRRVGFIGLGNMGRPMARRLVAAGFDTVVADLDPSRVSALVEVGARAAADAAEAVDGAEVVLTSLPGPAEVRAVAEEIIPIMEPGVTWIDLSTNDLDCGRHLARLADRRGIHVLDAPVTGGVEGAEAGTLTVLVGGDPAVHHECRPVLAAIGERYDRLGPHGAGYVAKIAQVMLCYLHSVCLTEAMLLGVKGGVEPERMLDVIRHSTGRSYVADRYGPEMLSGGYDDSFALSLAAKDLRLAVHLADDVGAQLEITSAVDALYRRAEANFGAAAPHLIAMQAIETANDLVLHQYRTPTPPSRHRSTT